jgi:RNA polymerase sigma-70 factor (ECF subfamily)
MSMERRVRFEILYGKHAPAVKAYVLRRAAPAVADDLVAEVFMVCWRRFDEIPAHPLPWLLGVARRVLSTYRRGERRGAALRQRLADNADAPGVVGWGGGAPTSTTTGGGVRSQRSPGEGTPLPASSGEGGGALHEALAQLSESDRELLLLIAWEGLSPAQAAAAMDVSPATVRVRLHRARRRLARALPRERGERGEWGAKGERGKTRASDETRARSEADEIGEPLPCTPLTMEAP